MKKIVMLFLGILMLGLYACKENNQVEMLFSSSYYSQETVNDNINYIDNYESFVLSGYPLNISEDFFKTKILYIEKTYIGVAGENLFLLDSYQLLDQALNINLYNANKNTGSAFSMYLMIFSIEKELFKNISDIIVKEKGNGFVFGLEEANVIFDLNYGFEPIYLNLQVNKGSTIEKPENPNRSGYIFDGWFLENELFDFRHVIGDDIRLVAKWKWILQADDVALIYSSSATIGIFNSVSPTISDYQTYLESGIKLDLEETFFETHLIYVLSFYDVIIADELYKLEFFKLEENVLFINCMEDIAGAKNFYPMAGGHSIVLAIKKELFEQTSDVQVTLIKNR